MPTSPFSAHSPNQAAFRSPTVAATLPHLVARPSLNYINFLDAQDVDREAQQRYVEALANANTTQERLGVLQGQTSQNVALLNNYDDLVSVGVGREALAQAQQQGVLPQVEGSLANVSADAQAISPYIGNVKTASETQAALSDNDQRIANLAQMLMGGVPVVEGYTSADDRAALMNAASNQGGKVVHTITGANGTTSILEKHQKLYQRVLAETGDPNRAALAVEASGGPPAATMLTAMNRRDLALQLEASPAAQSDQAERKVSLQVDLDRAKARALARLPGTEIIGPQEEVNGILRVPARLSDGRLAWIQSDYKIVEQPNSVER